MEQIYRLSEALEKFSDPEILSRFNVAEKACIKRGWVPRRFDQNVLLVGKPPRGFRTLTADLDRAREALYAPFIAKLMTGELVAVGTAYPATPESTEVKITTVQWGFLKPLFTTEESVAEGGGLRFVGVRVGPSSERTFFNTGERSVEASASRIGQDHERRKRRSDETRPEIITAIEKLESTDGWAKHKRQTRCGLIERHLKKPDGWCTLRSLDRAMADLKNSRNRPV